MEKRIKISGPGLFWPGQTPRFKNAGSGVPWRKFWIGYHARSTTAILSSFWSFPVVGKLPPNPRPQNFYSLFHSPAGRRKCIEQLVKHHKYGTKFCIITENGAPQNHTSRVVHKTTQGFGVGGLLSYLYFVWVSYLQLQKMLCLHPYLKSPYQLVYPAIVMAYNSHTEIHPQPAALRSASKPALTQNQAWRLRA